MNYTLLREQIDQDSSYLLSRTSNDGDYIAGPESDLSILAQNAAQILWHEDRGFACFRTIGSSRITIGDDGKEILLTGVPLDQLVTFARDYRAARKEIAKAAERSGAKTS